MKGWIWGKVAGREGGRGEKEHELGWRKMGVG